VTARCDTQRFAVPVRAIPWNGAATMDFNLRRLNFLGDQNLLSVLLAD
jgi:hypothetical protein